MSSIEISPDEYARSIPVFKIEDMPLPDLIDNTMKSIAGGNLGYIGNEVNLLKELAEFGAATPQGQSLLKLTQNRNDFKPTKHVPIKGAHLPVIPQVKYDSLGVLWDRDPTFYRTDTSINVLDLMFGNRPDGISVKPHGRVAKIALEVKIPIGGQIVTEYLLVPLSLFNVCKYVFGVSKDDNQFAIFTTDFVVKSNTLQIDGSPSVLAATTDKMGSSKITIDVSSAIDLRSGHLVWESSVGYQGPVSGLVPSVVAFKPHFELE